MPKVDVGVVATGLTKARSMTLSDGDVARTTAALKVFYGQIEDGVDADGNPVLRNRTDEEAWDRFFEGVKRSLLDIVKKVESESAAATASADVTEIAIS